MTTASIFRPDLLSGRRALVTGGGTGIGLGIARAFLAHGARVCITSRKAEVLEAAAEELARETGGEVMAAAADVRDPEQVERAVAAAAERFGGLDTLVNSAAGNFLAPAAALSPNGFRTVVDIDLVGTFCACRAVFPRLVEAGDGLILNLSATLQSRGTPLQSHAAAAKAGIDSLTRTLAVEWGRFGIRVNAIAPGPIDDTEGMRRLAPGGARERLERQVPLGRFGKVDEIAAAAVFLRSPASGYTTGSIVVIDGGESIAHPGLAAL